MVYFSTLNSVSNIYIKFGYGYIFIFVSVPHYFDYCSIIATFKIFIIFVELYLKHKIV